MTQPSEAVPRGRPRPSQPSIGPVEFDVRVWVYGTITLMSVLVVFDGWADLTSSANLVAVVIGPTLALALAHLFADIVDRHADERRALTVDEFRRLTRHSAEYLLVAVPPLVVFFLVAWLTEDPRVAIRWMIMSGSASLGGWGIVAGWRAGYRGWRLLASMLAGLVIGVVIIGLQVALKPH